MRVGCVRCVHHAGSGDDTVVQYRLTCVADQHMDEDDEEKDGGSYSIAQDILPLVSQPSPHCASGVRLAEVPSWLPPAAVPCGDAAGAQDVPAADQ